MGRARKRGCVGMGIRHVLFMCPSRMSRGEKEGEDVPSCTKDIPPAQHLRSVHAQRGQDAKRERCPVHSARVQMGSGSQSGGVYLPHADWAMLLCGPRSSQTGGRGPPSDLHASFMCAPFAFRLHCIPRSLDCPYPVKQEMPLSCNRWRMC